MKKRVHLCAANSSNKWGMEYFVKKAFEEEGFEVVCTDYRVMPKEHVTVRLKHITDVDLLLVIKGERLSPLDLWCSKVPKVLWMQDSIQANNDVLDVIKNRAWAYDIAYSFDNSEVPLYKPHLRKGAVCKWLPLAADPEIHQARLYDKSIDIGFVGSITQSRIDIINYINQYFPIQYNYSHEEYNSIVNKTKINLNIGIIPSGNQQRIFEILSMGGFLLTNDIPNSDKLFEDGKHLVYYSNDILDKIQYYLSNEEERNQIALNGCAEVIKKHTYIDRVRQIVKDVESL